MLRRREHHLHALAGSVHEEAAPLAITLNGPPLRRPADSDFFVWPVSLAKRSTEQCAPSKSRCAVLDEQQGVHEAAITAPATAISTGASSGIMLQVSVSSPQIDAPEPTTPDVYRVELIDGTELYAEDASGTLAGEFRTLGEAIECAKGEVRRAVAQLLKQGESHDGAVDSFGT
ncbi:MAG: hypothetical protein ABIT36_04130 [Steroidobacteraceae bacterium]